MKSDVVRIDREVQRAKAGDEGVDKIAGRTVRAIRTPPPFVPRRIQDTIDRIGGWERLLQMKGQQTQWVQREFYKHYELWERVETVEQESESGPDDASNALSELLNRPGEKECATFCLKRPM
jgi:hypothetical protein